MCTAVHMAHLRDLTSMFVSLCIIFRCNVIIPFHSVSGKPAADTHSYSMDFVTVNNQEI